MSERDHNFKDSQYYFFLPHVGQYIQSERDRPFEEFTLPYEYSVTRHEVVATRSVTMLIQNQDNRESLVRETTFELSQLQASRNTDPRSMTLNKLIKETGRVQSVDKRDPHVLASVDSVVRDLYFPDPRQVIDHVFRETGRLKSGKIGKIQSDAIQEAYNFYVINRRKDIARLRQMEFVREKLKYSLHDPRLSEKQKFTVNEWISKLDDRIPLFMEARSIHHTVDDLQAIEKEITRLSKFSAAIEASVPGKFYSSVAISEQQQKAKENVSALKANSVLHNSISDSLQRYYLHLLKECGHTSSGIYLKGERMDLVAYVSFPGGDDSIEAVGIKSKGESPVITVTKSINPRFKIRTVGVKLSFDRIDQLDVDPETDMPILYPVVRVRKDGVDALGKIYKITGVHESTNTDYWE